VVSDSASPVISECSSVSIISTSGTSEMVPCGDRMSGVTLHAALRSFYIEYLIMPDCCPEIKHRKSSSSG
jgi:hypothetical protein